MISRRLAAVSLALLAFAGCHEDPSVLPVLVSGAASALSLITNGGGASTPTLSAGAGANGGGIQANVLGDLNLGGSTTIATPVVPAIPTTGATLPTPAAGGSAAGNVIVSGSVTINPVANVTFQSNGGDLIVSGSLVTSIVGGAQTNITLSAPSGTVYLTGSIVTTSADGTPSTDRGGDVIITAARIVVTGSLNTSGESGTTVAGGRGGDVTMTSTTGSILVTGSVLTPGGTGINGGRGGDITLDAAGQISAFAIFTSSGGAASDLTGGTPVGGTGGDVTLTGDAGVDVSSTINLRGGSGTGDAAGAGGGPGGNFNVSSTGAVKVYGVLNTSGGTATANAGTMATLTGGAGGDIAFGPGPALPSLELGRGTWSTIGGPGVDVAGSGNDIVMLTTEGTIVLGSDLDTRGAAATGTANTAGGDGGTVSLQTDVGGSNNHALAILFDASVTTSGGAGSGTGNGGDGGSVLFQSGGDLTSPILITTTGGIANGTGGGGQGGDITLNVTSAAGAVGDILLSGVLTTLGGLPTSGPGGQGGTVQVSATAANAGSITSSANIFSSGADGVGVAGAGGTAGNISFATSLGDVVLSGIQTARGGGSGQAGQTRPGGSFTVTVGVAGGFILCTSTIDVSGGGSTDSTLAIDGAPGGPVLFFTGSPDGSITLDSLSTITSNGGGSSGTNANPSLGVGGIVSVSSATGFLSLSGAINVNGGVAAGLTGTGGAGGVVNCSTSVSGILTVVGGWSLNGGTGTLFGGPGGTVNIATVSDAVTLSGSITAVGGSSSGAGGLGGGVLVNTDSDSNRTGGNITLASGASIDVSGGSGLVQGGAARNDGGLGTATLGLLSVAVVFDADGTGSLSGGGDPAFVATGIITNLGSITASAGAGGNANGGDIVFDGFGAGGVGDPVSGTATRAAAGTGQAGFFLAD